jgi:hypothetical protein
VITLNRMRLHARHAWYLAQARLLIAQVNRRQAQRRRLPNPGYDELSCPWFVGVMFAAILVLSIDMGDKWPEVIAFILSATSGA